MRLGTYFKIKTKIFVPITDICTHVFKTIYWQSNEFGFRYTHSTIELYSPEQIKEDLKKAIDEYVKVPDITVDASEVRLYSSIVGSFGNKMADYVITIKYQSIVLFHVIMIVNLTRRSSQVTVINKLIDKNIYWQTE